MTWKTRHVHVPSSARLIQRERERKRDAPSNINHTSIRLSSWHFAAIMTVNCETSVGKKYIREDLSLFDPFLFSQIWFKVGLRKDSQITREKIQDFCSSIDRSIDYTCVCNIILEIRDPLELEFHSQGTITLGPIVSLSARILPLKHSKLEFHCPSKLSRSSGNKWQPET